MPISPIELFRPQPLDGVQQILGGGLNVLASALKDSVAIGRDMSNLQATQEKEYLAEQERVANMDFRRGEAARQQSNLDRNFVEDQSRDTRDYTQKVKQEDRVFDETKSYHAQELALQGFRDINAVADKQEQLDLEKRKVKALEDKSGATLDYKSRRASEILDQTREPSLIEKLFHFGAGDNTQQEPQTKVKLGTELKGLAADLRDPNLAAKGDQLINSGQADINATRLRPVRSTKKTPETMTPQERKDRIFELTSWLKYAADQESVQKIDLTPDEREKKRKYTGELNLILSKEMPGNKNIGSPLLPVPANPLDRSLNYYTPGAK